MSEEQVLAKAAFFVDVRLWPLVSQLNARGWLSNFSASEKEHAANLLNAFLFLSSQVTDALFVSAIHQLSSVLSVSAPDFQTAQANWESFFDSAIVVHVEGEIPSVADSGYAFARRARTLLQFSETQLLRPADALAFLQQHGPRPVIFVDDFAGTGSQFETTWFRPTVTGRGSEPITFDKIAQEVGGQFFFCPLLCTSTALRNLQVVCPQVVVAPAHVLSDRYNMLSDQCHLWPEHLRSTAREFVRTASDRAGISLDSQHGWEGYQQLGLAVAFEHSVPDATLPLFYWEENGWIPLIRRR